MNFCLAKPGEFYLIFSLNGGTLTVDLVPRNAYKAIQNELHGSWGQEPLRTYN